VRAGEPAASSGAGAPGRAAAEAIRPRGGAATRRTKELREFLVDYGPTRDCAGCKRSRTVAGMPDPGNTGARHSVTCRVRRAEWERTRAQKRSAELSGDSAEEDAQRLSSR
jgi:hypothetical protein